MIAAPYRPTFLYSLLGCVALSLLVSSGIGAYKISFWRIPEILLTKAEGFEVLTQIRFPRVLLAVVVGASLGIAGASMQALFRNPLAEPGLIGVTSGSALGAAAWIVLAADTAGAIWGSGLAAFAGGATVAWVAWFAARASGFNGTMLLILAGVAMNSLASAGLGVLVFISNDQQLRSLSFWLMGGLGGATWTSLCAAAIPASIGILLLVSARRRLNLLALGEEDAWSLGMETGSLHKQILFGSTLAVGASVAAAGGIGFIGLIVPHVLRMTLGPDHRYLLPASALLGAVVLILADAVARVVFAPAEIPAGIVTAFIGAPFFLWLLSNKRRELMAHA